MVSRLARENRRRDAAEFFHQWLDAGISCPRRHASGARLFQAELSCRRNRGNARLACALCRRLFAALAGEVLAWEGYGLIECPEDGVYEHVTERGVIEVLGMPEGCVKYARAFV